MSPKAAAATSNAAPALYTCLFCNKPFTAEEVLFADIVTNAAGVAPDGELRKHYDNFISTPMEVPTQLLYTWANLPRESIRFNADIAEEIPEEVMVNAHDGFLPKADKDAQNGASQAGGNLDSRRALFQSSAALHDEQSAGAEKNDHKADPRLESIFRAIPEGATKKLRRRVCPHCHCEVPHGLGHYSQYRIAMLGGTSAGKTTYMLLAGHQLRELANDSLELADGKLIGQSGEYFDKEFDSYRHGNKRATIKGNEYTIKPAFPLILLMRPNAQAFPPFFLILQDFPGEGMLDSDYLNNYPGVAEANGAIFLIDPSQLFTLEKADAELNTTHCPHSLSKTCDALSACISGFAFLKKIVITLNKLDCLYEATPPDDPKLNRGRYPLLDNGDLSQSHKTAVSFPVVDDIHQMVNQILAELRGSSDQSANYQYFVNQMGCRNAENIAISFKAISCHTWQPAAERFVSHIGDQVGIGHRLLEPLLELLADAGLFPATHADSDTQQPAQKPKRWFWRK